MSNARPITFDGVTYPSRKAAARALGIHRRTLDKWVQSGRTKKQRSNGQSVPVEIDGVRYSSMSEAKKETGLSRDAIRYFAGIASPSRP